LYYEPTYENLGQHCSKCSQAIQYHKCTDHWIWSTVHNWTSISWSRMRFSELYQRVGLSGETTSPF